MTPCSRGLVAFNLLGTCQRVPTGTPTGAWLVEPARETTLPVVNMSTDSPRDRTASDVGPTRRRPRWRRAGYVVIGLGLAGTIAWIGLQIHPQPLSAAPVEPGETTTTPLPAGLPAPVERFYRQLYGDQLPVVDTAVISGRGELRISGITFPARWRFSHITGQAYRHYIELTVFGRRLTAVNEWFLDGDARLELPFGVSQGPNIDQGANLALWAEAVWMPSVWVTDPAARWEPIDETSARLVVSPGEAFTVQFDPDTGLLERMESMRFKGEADEQRTLWINEVLDWGEVDGRQAPLRTEISWGDESSPWAHLDTESVIYNADLAAYIEGEGP